MNLTRYKWVLLSIILIINFQGCNNQYSDENTKTLRIQVQNEPDILNPAISALSVSSFIESMMVSPLAIRNDAGDSWIPVLIQEFEPRLLDQAVEYPLVLRPEAKWSDGEQVSVTDMLYTLKMGLNPYISRQSWASYLDIITSIREENDTLILTMDTPYLLADEFIAGLSPYPSHVLDPGHSLDSIRFDQMKEGDFSNSEDHLLRTLAQDFNNFGTPHRPPKPVSGLYTISHWSAGQNITLTRIKDFWAQNVDLLNPYYDTNIDTLQFVVISDPQNALNAFTSGNIDVLNTLDPRDSALISSHSGQIHQVPTLQLYYVALNHRNPLLGQLNIRRALNLAINREDLLHRLFQGNGQVASGPIHPAKSYYEAFLVDYAPQKAREILKQAGCRDIDGDGILECPGEKGKQKLAFHIWTTRSRISRDVATLLKSYWKPIGIELEIQSTDFRSFLPELQNKTYDMATLALRQNNVLDDPFPLWHSSQTGPGGKNYQALANDSIDYILEHLRESLKPSAQKKYYHMFQKIFADEVPVLFLVAPGDVVGVREGVELRWCSQRPGYDLLRSKVFR